MERLGNRYEIAVREVKIRTAASEMSHVITPQTSLWVRATPTTSTMTTRMSLSMVSPTLCCFPSQPQGLCRVAAYEELECATVRA